jgi:uracil-DNA glycosylase
VNNLSAALSAHQGALKVCKKCPEMIGPVVTGQPVVSPVFLVGQAPGVREGEFGKPFAWTAGKTMFQWFSGIGLEEDLFRRKVYMAAVCRCFPGKNPKGGDRVPSREEIQRCADWMDTELRLLKPELIIPVGKLAIAQLMPVNLLNDVVGRMHRVAVTGFETDAIPLPHPSGASPWHRIEPGKSLLTRALELIKVHPAWKRVCRGDD